MKGLQEEFRSEAYNNLRQKYDQKDLTHVRFTKAELIRLFNEKFAHKPNTPVDNLHHNNKISCEELLQFVREITIGKKLEEEIISVEKNFYQTVKQMRKS